MSIKILGLRQDCYKVIIDGVLFKFPTEQEFLEFLEEVEI